MNLYDSLSADGTALRSRFPEIFQPDWKARAATVGVVGGGIALLAYGFWSLDFTWSRFFTGINQLGTFIRLMLPPDAGSWNRFLIYLNGLGETLAIAFLGTMVAAIIAFPLGFLAARQIMPGWVFRFTLRRGLDTLRAVDILIWALIWINVVGLGPFAGVLALICSDIGSFGKLYSEAIEAADRKAAEGVLSTGGSSLHRLRFGLLPQVLPVMTSQVLYFFESNTRSATIIGIVGAGGIGQHLAEQIRTLEWQHVSFLVLMILLTVSIIDLISSRLRFAIIGAHQQH